MRIAIVGAGAMGCLYGGLLARATAERSRRQLHEPPSDYDALEAAATDHSSEAREPG